MAKTEQKPKPRVRCTGAGRALRYINDTPELLSLLYDLDLLPEQVMENTRDWMRMLQLQAWHECPASLAAAHGSASGPQFNRSWLREIHAVGPTVEAALQHLRRGLGLGKVENIELQKHDGAPCEWYVRFTAGGTSMKAAGEYVRGGVLVTWWK